MLAWRGGILVMCAAAATEPTSCILVDQCGLCVAGLGWACEGQTFTCQLGVLRLYYSLHWQRSLMLSKGKLIYGFEAGKNQDRLKYEVGQIKTLN